MITAMDLNSLVQNFEPVISRISRRMIKKMGLENWAQNQAKLSFDRYYNDKLDTCM
jgi:hypothetical protein